MNTSHSNPPEPDAVVIGGGLVGWATAHALAKRGVATMLIDAADPGAATMASAGMITPGTHPDPPDGYLPLAIAAMNHYPRLIEELAEAGGGPTDYQDVGGLFVARDESEVANLDDVEQRLRGRRESGLRSIGEIKRIDGEQARSLFPPLSPAISSAVWFSGGARVNGRQLRASIRGAALRLGCQEVVGRASLGRAGTHVEVVDPWGERHGPDIVVIAGGAWSPIVSTQIGVALPIRPQKGQILHLAWKDDSTAAWPVLESASSHYMVGLSGTRLVCGATRELDAGFSIDVTTRGLHEILTAALAIAPGVGGCPIVETRAGLRPWSPDGLPGIGRLPETNNAWLCSGHGASGLTLGPYSGELLAQMAIDQQPDIDPTPYSPERWLVA